MKRLPSLNRIFASGAVIFLLSGGLGLAEPFRQHTFGISPEVYRAEYEEKEINVRVHGVMYGGSAFYAYHHDTENNDWMMKFEGRGAYGEVDYSSDRSGSMDSIPDYTYEMRFLLGYDIHREDGIIYTLYAGVGYRYLNDDTSNMVTTENARGYERESNYFYSPLGIEAHKFF